MTSFVPSTSTSAGRRTWVERWSLGLMSINQSINQSINRLTTVTNQLAWLIPAMKSHLISSSHPILSNLVRSIHRGRALNDQAKTRRSFLHPILSFLFCRRVCIYDIVLELNYTSPSIHCHRSLAHSLRLYPSIHQPIHQSINQSINLHEDEETQVSQSKKRKEKKKEKKKRSHVHNTISISRTDIPP